LLAEPPPFAMKRIVAVLPLRVDLDLRRHVRARVLLLEHGKRRELRIAQVLFQVRVARALRERGLVVTLSPDQPAFLAHDDRGAGVLAHRQHAARRDVGVLQQVVGDELVVVGRLGVLDDRAERGEMRGPQQMIDVVERGLAQRPHRLVRDDQHLAAEDFFDAHAGVGDAGHVELAVGGGVGAEREERRVAIGREGVGGERGVHGKRPDDPSILDISLAGHTSSSRFSSNGPNISIPRNFFPCGGSESMHSAPNRSLKIASKTARPHPLSSASNCG